MATPPKVSKPKVHNAPPYGSAGNAALGLTEKWGVAVELVFSIDAKEGSASKKKNKGRLYIHHTADGAGLLWNEKGQKTEWKLDVSEYFILREGGARWTTKRDVQNNWYPAHGNGGEWNHTTYCGISIYVKGKVTVGRLTTSTGELLKAPLVCDNKNSSSSNRPKVGATAKQGGTDIGVTDAQSNKPVPKGGLLFSQDKAFGSTSYEYWIQKDNCPKGTVPQHCGPPTPKAADTGTAGSKTKYAWRETRTVAKPAPSKENEEGKKK